MGFSYWLSRVSMPKGGIRFVCEMADRLKDKNPPHPDVIILTIYNLAKKANKPYFRNYTAEEIQNVCKGSIPVLAFTAMHQGTTGKLLAFAHNKDILNTELRLVHDLITSINPKYLTGDYGEYQKEAEISLYAHPAYTDIKLKSHGLKR